MQWGGSPDFEVGIRTARLIERRMLFGDLARTLRDNGQEDDITSRYPALTRGCIFQERLLSRRTLHCSRGEISWECLSENRCECTGDPFDPEE